MWPRITLGFGSSCLPFPSDGITSVHFLTQFVSGEAGTKGFLFKHSINWGTALPFPRGEQGPEANQVQVKKKKKSLLSIPVHSGLPEVKGSALFRVYEWLSLYVSYHGITCLSNHSGSFWEAKPPVREACFFATPCLQWSSTQVPTLSTACRVCDAISEKGGMCPFLVWLLQIMLELAHSHCRINQW